MTARLIKISEWFYEFRDTSWTQTPVNRELRQIEELCVHHSACCLGKDTFAEIEQTLRAFDNNHTRLHSTKNWFGTHIAYHCVFAMNGDIILTRPFKERWRHCANLDVNKRWLWFCAIWNFEIEKPTEAVYVAMWKAIAEARRTVGNNVAIWRHDELKATACPWKNFDTEKLFNEVKKHWLQDLEWIDKKIRELHKLLPNYAENSALKSHLEDCNTTMSKSFNS